MTYRHPLSPCLYVFLMLLTLAAAPVGLALAGYFLAQPWLDFALARTSLHVVLGQPVRDLLALVGLMAGIAVDVDMV